jgi:hypothetical protein
MARPDSPRLLARARPGLAGDVPPHLDEAADDLLGIAERRLHQAYRIAGATGQLAGPDPLSARRASVEPDEQDAHCEPLDVVVDAFRDTLRFLVAAGDPATPARLKVYAGSPYELLRRLAVDGWTHRTDVDATGKLRHALHSGWFFDAGLRRESFALLGGVVADAAPDALADLVHEVTTGQESGAISEYELFNLLVWIERQARGVPEAVDALKQLRQRHPEYQESERPERLRVVSWGAVEPRAPMTPEALHEAVATDAVAASALLAEHLMADDPFDVSTRTGTLALVADVADVADVAGRWPDDGLRLLDAATAPELVTAVITGWARAVTDRSTAETILERLLRVDLEATGREVTVLLNAAQEGEAGASRTDWHLMRGAQELAAVVWDDLPRDWTDRLQPAGLNWAINTTAGQLGLFWVRVLAAEWRDAGDSWSGIPGELRTSLELRIDAEDDQSRAAQIVLASQVLFFYRADRDWALAQILPLLSWSTPELARGTWDGYLMWGRWNDDLLRDGLLRHLRSATEHLAELDEEQRRHVLRRLAEVALRSECEVIGPAGWLHPFATRVGVAERVEWTRQVGWLLEDLPAAAVRHEWQRWMP